MSNTSGEKNITEILKTAAADNSLACAKVFEISSEHTIFPDIAGITMTHNKIKITHCQLGLFGYPEGKKIPDCGEVSKELEHNIYDALENKKLPCGAAWNIAAEMKIKKIDVTAACEKLGIKINKCQLGAF